MASVNPTHVISEATTAQTAQQFCDAHHCAKTCQLGLLAESYTPAKHMIWLRVHSSRMYSYDNKCRLMRNELCGHRDRYDCMADLRKYICTLAHDWMAAGHPLPPLSDENIIREWYRENEEFQAWMQWTTAFNAAHSIPEEEAWGPMQLLDFVHAEKRDALTRSFTPEKYLHWLECNPCPTGCTYAIEQAWEKRAVDEVLGAVYDFEGKSQVRKYLIKLAGVYIQAHPPPCLDAFDAANEKRNKSQTLDKSKHMQAVAFRKWADGIGMHEDYAPFNSYDSINTHVRWEAENTPEKISEREHEEKTAREVTAQQTKHRELQAQYDTASTSLDKAQSTFDDAEAMLKAAKEKHKLAQDALASFQEHPNKRARVADQAAGDK